MGVLEEPGAWCFLLSGERAEHTKLAEAYTDLVVEYLSAQADAGAHALQVFEAMGMTLGAKMFEEPALPHLEALGLEAEG